MQVGVLLSCHTSSVHSTAPLTVSVHIQHRSHLVGQSAPSALAYQSSNVEGGCSDGREGDEEGVSGGQEEETGAGMQEEWL